MRKVFYSFALVLLIHACAFAQTSGDPAAAAKRFKEASQLQNAGKFAEAVSKWREFVRDHSADPALGLAYQGLGTCLLETGDWRAAIDALQLALKRVPEGESSSTIRWNLAIGLYRRAESTKSAEDRKIVAEALQEILSDKQAPKDRHALAAFYLARTELAAGDKTAAKKRFEHLLRTETNKELLPSVILAVAGLEEDAKDWPKAEKLYRRFVSDFPKHVSADEAQLGLADVLFRQEKYQEAESLFGQLVEKPGLAGADYIHFRWAEAAELRGDLKVGAERWKSFTEKHPKSGFRERALRRAGEDYFQVKQWPEATKAFSTWLSENPSHEDRATTRVQLGLALTQMEKWIEAEPHFKAALERLPDGDLRSQALLGSARCAVKAKRPADAVNHYSELLAVKAPTFDVETTTLEAVSAAFAADDSKHGLEWTDRLVEKFAKSPRTSQAQLHAARYLTEHGQFDAAIKRSQWVIDAKDAESQPPALYLAGFCAMKLRKFSDAVAYYQSLRDDYSKAEQAPVAAYSIGVAYESQGATAKALAAYQLFLERYSSHSLAAEARKRVRILQGSD